MWVLRLVTEIHANRFSMVLTWRDWRVLMRERSPIMFRIEMMMSSRSRRSGWDEMIELRWMWMVFWVGCFFARERERWCGEEYDVWLPRSRERRLKSKSVWDSKSKTKAENMSTDNLEGYQMGSIQIWFTLTSIEVFNKLKTSMKWHRREKGKESYHCCSTTVFLLTKIWSSEVIVRWVEVMMRGWHLDGSLVEEWGVIGNQRWEMEEFRERGEEECGLDTVSQTVSKVGHQPTSVINSATSTLF